MRASAGRVHVAVIGGGQAGLAVSHELTARDVEHVVLERRRVGQTWRDRWDSFCLVTPNWTVQLPGGAWKLLPGPEEGPAQRASWVARVDEAHPSRATSLEASPMSQPIRCVGLDDASMVVKQPGQVHARRR